jgi:aspartate/methionine/tyrosine aminotransferase
MVGCGVDIREVRLDFDDAYAVDPERIAAALTDRTRLVCIASPQNPSGVQTPLGVLRELLRQMAKRAPQALLFVEETYREACYGEANAGDHHGVRRHHARQPRRAVVAPTCASTRLKERHAVARQRSADTRWRRSARAGGGL